MANRALQTPSGWTGAQPSQSPPPVDEQLLGNKQHGGHVSCIQLLAEHKAKHGVEQAPLSAPSLVCNKILDLLTLHMRQHR